jgi:RNA polymerase sigma-70 factor (ECF subfamily)
MKAELTHSLLERARRGEADAMGQLLEHYQPYLYLLAQRRLSPRIRTRVDPSDIVQQTLFEAQRDLSAFRGDAAEELSAWLRRILQHNVQQSVERHWQTKKRSLQQERSLNEPLDGGQQLCELLAAEQSSPSQRAMKGEAAVQLARAICQLPEDQREAVRLRHLEGFSLKQLAETMGRSEMAVAGLIKRGLQGLREQLQAGDSASNVNVS